MLRHDSGLRFFSRSIDRTVRVKRQPLTILLAQPRGFCAGVVRALDMVENALRTFGPPIYVRHQIVHNPFVIRDLAARGVVFVEDISDVPPGSRLLFSAHGVSKTVEQQALLRGLKTLDATCPLVTKVHREVVRQAAKGRHVLIVGQSSHVEVIGTAGQVAPGQTTLIESLEDAQNLALSPGQLFAVVTQTTLSVDETSAILAELRRRIPDLVEPSQSDICFATTNRQAVVKLIAPRSDAVAILGGRDSSNSRKMVATAKAAGCARSALFEEAGEVQPEWLVPCRTLGVASGASTPEASVDALLDRLDAWYVLEVQKVTAVVEEVTFRSLPIRQLA